jgi:uncharacterized protein YdeI (YjbR/CyaY-like superfamily)
MNPKVDKYFADGCMQCHLRGTPECKIHDWQEELKTLRRFVLDCGLDEDFKWMHPCYTYKNKNIVLIHLFNEYCALLFPKGSLLKDSANILVQQTKNVQAARQIRFTDVSEIVRLESTIIAYIFEAIELEKEGVKVPYKKTSEFDFPEEFRQKLKESPALKSAFEALTPGRQRGYLLYFSQPKQSKTRESRIEKCTPGILSGKGLNDR